MDNLSNTDSSTSEKIGRLIKQRRKSLGFTQKDLATKLNITAQQLQKYETGINCLRINKLLLFAKALRLPLSYFFVALYEQKESLNSSNLKEKDDSFTHEDPPIDLQLPFEEYESASLQQIDEFLSNFLVLEKQTQEYIFALVKELAKK